MTTPHTSRVTLVAHASTDAVRAARFPDDEPLDRSGAAAAALVRVGRGAGDERRRVRSTPAHRCVETARAIGLSATADPTLPPWDVGSWRGQRLDELAATTPHDVARWLTDPDSTPHNGESLAALITRVGAWLEHASADSRHTLAVTEPAIIRAALAHVLPGGWQTFWRVDVGPLDQVELRRRGNVWTLRSLCAASESVAD